MREHTLITLNMIEYAGIPLNNQSSEYVRILHMSLYKLLSSYRDRGVFRTLSNV